MVEQDRQLARILEAPEEKVGSNRFVVVITANHGMPSEPQTPQKRYFNNDIVDLVHKKFDPERAALVTHFEPGTTSCLSTKIGCGNWD